MSNREERSLSAPIVFVNGRRMKVVPKSVSNQLPGSAKVRSMSAGGGDVEMVYGIDYSTMVCSVKFKLPNTAESVEFALDQNQARDAGVRTTIKIVEETTQQSYDQCTLVTQIEIPRDPEGEIDFEYQGRYTGA